MVVGNYVITHNVLFLFIHYSSHIVNTKVALWFTFLTKDTTGFTSVLIGALLLDP